MVPSCEIKEDSPQDVSRPENLIGTRTANMFVGSNETIIDIGELPNAVVPSLAEGEHLNSGGFISWLCKRSRIVSDLFFGDDLKASAEVMMVGLPPEAETNGTRQPDEIASVYSTPLSTLHEIIEVEHGIYQNHLNPSPRAAIAGEPEIVELDHGSAEQRRIPSEIVELERGPVDPEIVDLEHGSDEERLIPPGLVGSDDVQNPSPEDAIVGQPGSTATKAVLGAFHWCSECYVYVAAIIFADAVLALLYYLLFGREDAD